jgi:hypothetical protein
VTVAKQLTDMNIDEISLVDDPANADATVQIFKAKSPDDKATIQKQAADILALIPSAIQELTQQIVAKAALTGGFPVDSVAAQMAASSLTEYAMDIQALSKALEDAEAKFVMLEKRATDAEALNATLTTENTILKGAAAANATEEDVIKSAPESVQKMLADLRDKAAASDAVISKMKDEQDMTASISKAKELRFGDPEQVGPLLLRIRKASAEDADTVTALLKRAGEVTKGSILFRQIGAADGATDPEVLLKAKAEEISKGNPSLSSAAAYEMALSQNPDLYSAYIAKRRVA